VSLLRSSFLLVAAFGAALIYGQATLEVTVDGKPVEFKDAPPQVITGRTMVPLRGVFEAIGAYVEYSAEIRTITVKRGNEVVELRLGERIAKKNGAEILMDMVPKVLGGTTMVPLRFVAESMGAHVDFDAKKNLIRILTD
jgi:hypothetical protein